MIEVIVDHSYAEDYFQIDTITVNLDDNVEKERIERSIKKSNLEGSLVDPGDLREHLAVVLGVRKEMIDIDTHEIDMY
ncbi:hypothetical protein JSQ81_02495 [Sporosarcina sp. Marseille-Q4063]|uniref:hypothetical protein n=1 Tax=Sporosarcina sp. Marseille-Q4063 TaxID=2810514 RepID=UPI001BAE8861|nr:hypothetical protein [Sporosarcina sp. Marseille-Q4063]QUW22476.1 hypothetical protein JSQ81_02495 [Sporosarcina sp. Marseille-Q4063]